MTPYNPFTAARAKRVSQKKARKIARRKRNRGIGGGRYYQPVEPRNPNGIRVRSIESMPRRFDKFRR